RRAPKVVVPRTILITVAEAKQRQSLARVVEKLGYSALAAASAADGLRLLEQNDPDFVLLALDLKGRPGGGLDALRQMHELAPEVPIIMLANNYHDGRTADAMRQGAIAYLARPFGADDLREVLARH